MIIHQTEKRKATIGIHQVIKAKKIKSKLKNEGISIIVKQLNQWSKYETGNKIKQQGKVMR